MVAANSERDGLSKARHGEQERGEMFETIGDIRRSYPSSSEGDAVNKQAV